MAVRFPKPKPKENPETALQGAVIELLLRLPEVAWAKRINTGAGMVGHRDKKTGEVKHSRFMRFGFVGCSDIVGQLKRRWQGRFVAIEAKVKGKTPTQEQQAFLDAVNAAGGVGIWLYDIADLIPKLRARIAAIERESAVLQARAPVSVGAARSVDAVATMYGNVSVEVVKP